jgi:hypothetical protein
VCQGFKTLPAGSSETMVHTALTDLFDHAGRIRLALRHRKKELVLLAEPTL